MTFSIENGFFHPSPSLAAEKQGENEHFQPIENLKREWLLRAWGNVFFSSVRARMIFSISGPSGCLNLSAPSHRIRKR